MTQLSLLDGLPPAARAAMPTEPIVRRARIEDNYRWTMERAWGSGPCILWCLLNPSDADSMRDDPTTWRMMGFSHRWGFGSMIVVNVYPFISANQQALRQWRKSWNAEEAAQVGFSWEMDHSAFNAVIRNQHIVAEQIDRAQEWVVGWGNGADAQDVEEFLQGVAECSESCYEDDRPPVIWKCLGKTLAGAPTHPLARGQHRIPDTAVLKPWR